MTHTRSRRSVLWARHALFFQYANQLVSGFSPPFDIAGNKCFHQLASKPSFPSKGIIWRFHCGIQAFATASNRSSAARPFSIDFTHDSGRQAPIPEAVLKN
jgi:hypothetical protein